MTCTQHTHSRCRRTRTALARRNARDTVVADEAGKAVWEGRQAAWGDGQGGVAGLVGWRAGWMAGRVWWRACRVAGLLGGGQGLVAGRGGGWGPGWVV